MAKHSDNDTIKCSFCGKSRDEVDRILAGPGVYICNECIQLCREILEEEPALADTDAIIETTLRPLLKTEGITAEKRQMLESFLNQYKTIVREEFSWQKTLPDYIRIYREIFTEEEIQSLIAFYESPTGQMFVRKTPLIMDKMNDVLSMKMTVIINRMQAALIETMGTPSR